MNLLEFFPALFSHWLAQIFSIYVQGGQSQLRNVFIKLNLNGTMAGWNILCIGMGSGEVV